MDNQEVKIIGIYTIDEHPDVHLVELTFNQPPQKIDVGKITQETNGLTKDSWQVPWDEKYLDEMGENVIGDYFQIPKNTYQTRLIFFFHFLDFSKPLLTQDDKLELLNPASLPQRLKGIVNYEEPD